MNESVYRERVYAGVLGKVLGVTMGKPFEGWPYERIVPELGEIDHYVHDQLNYPLICTDDDTSGTFTFLRALEDSGHDPNLTPAQIGETWLNYLIEGKSVLWWGGMGSSTEHTAYLRLLSGVPAPQSGSMALNGKRVAEQIGAQIFIDGWAMVCPGDPDRAVDFARRAATVSHDGEAVNGALVLAAMESLAFVEPDIAKLVEASLAYVPADCLIRRIVEDVRGWAAQNGDDWRATRAQVAKAYGADEHGVGHMIPNHALIHLALWHGGGDMLRSLAIVNTCGWDTDCNSGNLGCLLGIRNGLAGIPAPLRDPVADRLYLPTADSGRGITDCLTEAVAIVNARAGLEGAEPWRPKEGARFHFSLPGAVQGFRSEGSAVSNPDGKALRIAYEGRPIHATTPTFIPPNLADMHGYDLLASPTLYPGQEVVSRVRLAHGATGEVECALGWRAHGPEGPAPCVGEWTRLDSEWTDLRWRVPDEGLLGFEVGLMLRGHGRGVVEVDFLTWTGTPQLALTQPGTPSPMADKAWVAACDVLTAWPGQPESNLIVTQNHGRGMALLGCRDWRDYVFEGKLILRAGGRVGLGVCVQGLRRYVALLLSPTGDVALVQKLGEETVLARTTAAVPFDEPVRVFVALREGRIVAKVGEALLEAPCPAELAHGGVALIAEDGRLDATCLRIRPA